MPTNKLIRHPLMILLLVCLGVGFYKISVLGCVSNDSVTFMQFAQDLKTSPGQAIQTYDQHPGYPIIILASEWMTQTLGFEATLEHRIISAQMLTLLTRSVAVCFLYLIFCFFGNRKTAFVSIILVILIPAYANNGSEVLSDWPNLMLMTMALYFCLRGLRDKAFMNFMAGGLASGLAYWIRPEGAVFIVIMGIYTLIHLSLKKTGTFKLCACCGVMVACGAVITAPYMIYKGALFPKKKVLRFSVSDNSSERTQTDASYPPLQTNIAATTDAIKPIKAVLDFIEEMFNTIFLFTIPLLGMIIYKMKRFWHLNPQNQFLCLFIGLWLMLMIWLDCKHGYMSHRHIMPMVVFGFAWIVKGLHGTAIVLGSQRHNLHRNTAILMGICLALFVPKLVRPAHADKAAWREAGLWLKGNTPAEATLAVFDNRVGFYAERSFVPLQTTDLKNQDYLVVKTAKEGTTVPENADLVTTRKPDIDEVIRIYRLYP